MSVPPFNPPPPPFVPGPPTSGGAYPPPPPSQPRGSRTKWIVGGVVAVVALCCGGSAIIAAVSPDPAPLPAAALPSATSTVSPSPSVSTSSPAPAPSTSSPAAVKAATPAPPAKPKPPTFAKVSHRAWSKIARDPGANAGKAIIVYGAVTQFDNATGNSMFRANVDGVRHRQWYEYDTNTVLTVDNEALIEDFADEDMFEAKVIVSGEFSYESTFGSELSTPELSIVSIKRIR